MTAPPLYSDRDKLRAVEREIALRRAVYRKRVAAETMSASDAEHETGVMIAIAEDYRNRIANNEGLFPRAGNSP
jgi:hypothetical protein